MIVKNVCVLRNGAGTLAAAVKGNLLSKKNAHLLRFCAKRVQKYDVAAHFTK